MIEVTMLNEMTTDDDIKTAEATTDDECHE